MDSESYTVSLGNNNSEIRQMAELDFISFWDKQAKNLSWFSQWKKTLDWNPPFGKWFVGGTLNACYNALDIHQNTRAEKPAILWEGENGDSSVLTYKDLLDQVNKFSNALKYRIDDSKSKIVITADGGYRRGSVVKLKEIVDDAIKELDFVQNVI